MAAGKPIVAFNVPGLAEIVNGYGFLFDEGDVQKLREIIKKLFCDKPLYDEVAYKCLKRALDFDIEKCCKSIGRFIQYYVDEIN